MDSCAQETAGSVSRQLSVGVQRDYVANLGKQLSPGGGNNKAGVLSAAQQLIEFAELAAFSFPADPFAFGLAPLPPPVKKMETDRLIRTVTLVKFFNAEFGGVENLSVFQQILFRRV